MSRLLGLKVHKNERENRQVRKQRKTLFAKVLFWGLGSKLRAIYINLFLVIVGKYLSFITECLEGTVFVSKQ